MPKRNNSDLYIAMISVHGLIRGHDLELGRDADTGGQTKYVVELTRALARLPGIAAVDLFTRLVAAPEVSADYAAETEDLGEGARIVRIAAGPAGEYIPKESLWDHLDSFVDNLLAFIRDTERVPDIVHSHYADAGYVGSRLAHFLGVPLVHTGHSLGRVKRRRLLATGLSSSQIDKRYNMSRRIEAEELTLASADRVVTSTHQEIEEQYELYDHYQPGHMRVIPPGTNLELFHPPHGEDDWHTPVGQQIRRFLREPEKPLILALSRPDPRKNIAALLPLPTARACGATTTDFFILFLAGDCLDIGVHLNAAAGQLRPSSSCFPNLPRIFLTSKSSMPVDGVMLVSGRQPCRAPCAGRGPAGRI
jgi:sucrose-phosphate synthase